MGPIEQLEVLIPNFGRLVDAAGDSLDQMTPCEGWVVRDVFDHVNNGARMFAAAYTGGPVKERAIGENPKAAIAEALGDFVVALRAPGALERTVETPFGAMPGEVFGRLAALDLLMHTWDVATAIDSAPEVADDVVAAVSGFAHQALTDELRTPGLFGPEVEAPVGAPPLDALAAFTGRTR